MWSEWVVLELPVGARWSWGWGPVGGGGWDHRKPDRPSSYITHVIKEKIGRERIKIKRYLKFY